MDRICFINAYLRTEQLVGKSMRQVERILCAWDVQLDKIHHWEAFGIFVGKHFKDIDKTLFPHKCEFVATILMFRVLAISKIIYPMFRWVNLNNTEFENNELTVLAKPLNVWWVFCINYPGIFQLFVFKSLD